MSKRFKVFGTVILTWLLLQVSNWLLNSWLNENVTKESVGGVAQSFSTALNYLSGDFGLGFIAGALIFSLWDWPVLGVWLKKQKEKRRNKEEDEALANECDEISKYIYEQAVTLERIKNERFWEGTRQEDHDKSWREARAAEGREEERIRRQIGSRVQSVFIALKDRNIKIELWGFSLSQHDLPAASYLFAELANSLRAGNYLEKEFNAGRSNLPARM